jgi:hypothetical protein
VIAAVVAAAVLPAVAAAVAKEKDNAAKEGPEDLEDFKAFPEHRARMA